MAVYSATTFIALGDVGAGIAGKWVVEVKVPTTGTYSLIPRMRARGSTFALDTTAPAVSYINRTTETTVGGTAITVDGIYEIRADGLAIGLDLTVTAGSVAVTAAAATPA